MGGGETKADPRSKLLLTVVGSTDGITIRGPNAKLHCVTHTSRVVRVRRTTDPFPFTTTMASEMETITELPLVVQVPDQPCQRLYGTTLHDVMRSCSLHGVICTMYRILF